MSARFSHTNSTARLVNVAMIVAATVMAAASFSADRAQANDLIVYYDQSQLLRLPRPVAEVIIGNPSIADVTIQGGNLVVVTGKTFGMTNIIALDSERNIIQDQRVLVERDEKRIINVHKGTLRQSFSCTPNCSPTLTIGDDVAYFDSINKQAAIKTKFSAGGGSQPGGGAPGQ
ncbi:MAG: pilus assembly protein N-terminal domain-containing protein [Alphaproteobacteria bacterium]|nr:pilus assembly protein N-terminal domain-containing protein [Alphaproteobacteria bacterium]